MEIIYSVDLRNVSKGEAWISVMDRGFLYGDSIYEAIRTYRKRLFLLDKHYERLLKSASRLSLKVPFALKELENHLARLIEEANYDLYVRVIITRGEDDVFDLFPRKESKPKTVIIARKIHEYPKDFFTKGIKLAIVSIKRNSKTSLDPEIKSGNYLNNILAIMEAKQRGADDALMINENGYLTECTTSNVFIVKNGVVITPRLEVGILHGITRKFLMDIMKANKIPYEEANLTSKDVHRSDECFITATTKEVMPVRMCDDMIIGSGEVGPMTDRLMKLFRKEVLKLLGL